MGLSPRTLRPANNFTPKSIPGLALWLDASDASTLFQDAAATTPATATSDPVGAWLDKSGNARHVTQSVSGSRPTISATKQNGRNALAFNGSSQSLSIASYSAENGLPGLTRYVVASMSSAAPTLITRVWNGGGDSIFGTVSGEVRFFAGASAYSAVASTNYGLLTSGTNIIGSVYDGTAGSVAAGIKPYYNGAAIPPSSTSGTLPTTLPGGTPGFWIGSNIGVNSFWPGRIIEYITYSRALSASERQRLERYLAAKYGITLAPQVSNADAQDWVNRVYANGGTVSASTASAVNTFCDAIDSAIIRDRFYRLNLFCGSNLNAALVPLYRGPSLGGTQYGGTTDTNNAFVGVGTDYAETGAGGGLLGNGSTKYLNTGFNVDQLPGAANCHLSSFITGTQDIASARTLVGVLFNGTTDRYRLFLQLSGSTAPNYGIQAELGKANSAVANNRTNTNGGLILASRTTTTLLTLYDDAEDIGTSEASTAQLTGASPFFVFARNGPTEYYNGRMAAYSIGAGMQDDQVTAYNTAMQAFQSAMGRA